jgi:hypothetical protein
MQKDGSRDDKGYPGSKSDFHRSDSHSKIAGLLAQTDPFGKLPQ